MLTDNHGRTVNYARIAVTDRCNLRCRYCMPVQGLDWVPRRELLSLEEIGSLLSVFAELGISKIRFTGGEPFLRRDFMSLVRHAASLKQFEKIAITTNGTLTAPFVNELKDLGIHHVNLSLDTLNRERFNAMTRRDDFDTVMRTLDALLDAGISTRINAVIIEGVNEEDIIPLAELTRSLGTDVRFIEEMPFNGEGKRKELRWNHQRILEFLTGHFPGIYPAAAEPFATSSNYSVPGHEGKLGIIAAYSRTFCGTCNRLRLTPQGMIKTCLYDGGVLDLR
ncbi:MAG: GTP 3',8-cyclase MoaA, partial [Flavobacteriales bacterium]|nr:GTP 3',8-cyclase MoaA [Flavobacteriales bacterium]